MHLVVARRNPWRGLTSWGLLLLAFLVPAGALLVFGAGVGAALTVGQVAFIVALVCMIVWGPAESSGGR